MLELRELHIRKKLHFKEKSTNSRRKIRSKCWGKFREVYETGPPETLITNYVFCTKCSNFLLYNGTTTTKMNQHKCEAQSNVLTNFIQMDENNAVVQMHLSESDKIAI